jgi:hypothetical protein
MEQESVPSPSPNEKLMEQSTQKTLLACITEDRIGLISVQLRAVEN